MTLKRSVLHCGSLTYSCIVLLPLLASFYPNFSAPPLTQVTGEGTFLDVRTIGRFCYEDDLLTLSAVYSEGPSEGQPGFSRLYKEKSISSLKHRLLVYLWRRAEQDGSALAKRRFFQYFDQLRQLRMWKMQLLDEQHLFIKYTSEDVVTMRVSDPTQVHMPLALLSLSSHSPHLSHSVFLSSLILSFSLLSFCLSFLSPVSLLSVL